MRCGGREYVKNASAHRELATVHDQVHARIGVFDQTFGGFVEGQVLPHGEHERLDIAQSLDDWLDERADRHDENANRAEHRIGIARMLESAEHGHAAGHGVRARAQTLVRQGFPGFELGDVVRVAHHTRSAASPPVSSASRPEATTSTTGLPGLPATPCPMAGGQSRAQTFGDAGQDGVVDVVRSLDVAGGELQEGLVLFQLRQDAYQ